jgi:hypothetical protein
MVLNGMSFLLVEIGRSIIQVYAFYQKNLESNTVLNCMSVLLWCFSLPSYMLFLNQCLYKCFTDSTIFFFLEKQRIDSSVSK